jgi:hypothetical protein
LLKKLDRSLLGDTISLLKETAEESNFFSKINSSADFLAKKLPKYAKLFGENPASSNKVFSRKNLILQQFRR